MSLCVCVCVPMCNSSRHAARSKRRKRSPRSTKENVGWRGRRKTSRDGTTVLIGGGVTPPTTTEGWSRRGDEEGMTAAVVQTRHVQLAPTHHHSLSPHMPLTPLFHSKVSLHATSLTLFLVLSCLVYTMSCICSCQIHYHIQCACVRLCVMWLVV